MPQKSQGIASCLVSGRSIIGKIGRSPAKMLPRKNGTTALLTYSRSKWLGMVARNLCRAAERSGARRAAVPPSLRLWSLAEAPPATGRRAATPAPVRNVRRSILGSSLALWGADRRERRKARQQAPYRTALRFRRIDRRIPLCRDRVVTGGNRRRRATSRSSGRQRRSATVRSSPSDVSLLPRSRPPSAGEAYLALAMG